MKRRDFLSGLAVTSASLAAAKVTPNGSGNPSLSQPMTFTPAAEGKNIIICAANGYQYIDDGYQLLSQGADTLDAALKVVSGPENDPNDDSVGLGGLPNEDGVVELDACCMHGPTRRAGSVLDFLAGHGVDASRMQAVGHGKSAPVASNATAAGRAMNRRVVINIAPD